ncbi:alpha/beta hydrolase [Brevundimonas sp. 2R-24]|uniref:Alpha/beta hydrolase n=1 Tax=Peiella sedimenti TaxID=3061083 RepID=A0ABT8SHA6_9CAUL|nr:alpha/beta hydrolase [Caulobacteraceae bacterium XZ-24]
MPIPQISRRVGLAGLAAGLASACSPLAALNALAPRDPGARRVLQGAAYGPHERQKLDLFAPRREGPWPLVVFFYGGNWNSGSRDLYGWAAQAIAAQGFVVAAPDYRLVPQVRFPAFIEDAAAATALAARLAPEHGGSAQRIGLCGHSAGAHIALLTALDPTYTEAVGLEGRIEAVAGLAGPYAFLPLDVSSTIAAFGQWPRLEETQPVTYARADAPAVWLANGGEDQVVGLRNTTRLKAALEGAGAVVETAFYPDLDHAGMAAVLSPLFRGRAPVLKDMTDFLRRTLTA